MAAALDAKLFGFQQHGVTLFRSAQTALIPARQLRDKDVTKAVVFQRFARKRDAPPEWPAFCSTLLEPAQLLIAARHTHMSISALASPPRYGNVRRARLLREGSPRDPESRRAGAPRPWNEVPVAGALVQTTTDSPSHIRRWQWIVLALAAIAIHVGLVWYASHYVSREPPRKTTELNIEIVRPPKPAEAPKPEPPKPPPKAPPRQARVLPQIQQSDPLPQAVGESSEPPVAVAPVISAPPAPPPPPPPEPVTEPMGRAGYLNNPAPEYPQLAVRQGWQGTVLLRVRVLANGSVESAEVKQSSGRRLLDDEAVRTVKRWAFTPAKRGNTPIDGWASVPIEFILDQ